MIVRSVFLAMLIGSALAAAARAQTSYPMLMKLHPAAAQVGQTSEHEVFARYNVAGAFQVLVSGEGVSGEIIPPETKEGEKPTAERVKVRFTVAPDAAPGVRDFRLVTPQGASTLGQLVIVREPVRSEAQKNNTLAEAETIDIPATVCGTIESNEDIDFYKFRAEAGQALVFHVRSARLQDKIHDLQTHSDPLVALRNTSGTILAQSDNHFFADPLLHYQFEAGGDYYLEIRDVRYQGNANWTYSIEITPRPLVTNVFPMGLEPGVETRLELVGFQLPDEAQAALALPSDIAPGVRWLPLPAGDGSTNPAPLVASRFPVVIEAQANDAPEQAQLIQVPAGISGRIEREGDLDYYAFEAKQGERFSFEVIARREQSSLDSVLRILDSQGKQLVENDDLSTGRHTFADSWVENWAAPADGRYVIELRDLHLRGGAPFVYFLEVSRSQPYFTLEADTDKTVLSPGTGGVIFVRAYRKNGFSGEIQLAMEGLPPGVTASCGRILPDGKDGAIVLQAGADAALAAANIRITGKGTHVPEGGEPRELQAEANVLQEIYLPGGGRGHYPVEMHTVSVGERLDLRGVKIVPAAITLKPGESQKIEITIERAEGFDKNLTLDVLYRHLNGVYGDALPKGVSIDAKNSKTLLTGGETQGHITLMAAADAPAVENQQVPVMAHVAINFVMKMTYVAEPLTVSVAP